MSLLNPSITYLHKVADGTTGHHAMGIGRNFCCMYIHVPASIPGLAKDKINEQLLLSSVHDMMVETRNTNRIIVTTLGTIFAKILEYVGIYFVLLVEF